MVGLAVFTRHRLASYVVGGVVAALALLSVLSYLGIVKTTTGSIKIG